MVRAMTSVMCATVRKAPVFHGRGSSAGQILTSGWRVLVIGGALLQEQYSYEYFVFFARDSPSARGGAMLEAGIAASRHARAERGASQKLRLSNFTSLTRRVSIRCTRAARVLNLRRHD